MFKRTLVTSALPYANGPLHLGHLAGAYLPADLFVRYRRLKNDDIVFICGSDEHGVPITIAAEKEGVSPQKIVDQYHELNKETFEKFGISFDFFGRTSSKTHHETSQGMFKNLYDKGIFKQKTEEQYYDEERSMFLPDRYVKGECPVCGFDEAYGDQCEKCGSSLSPTELKNPVSVLSGSKPIRKETTHWYIPLGDLQPELEKWLDTKDYWKNNVLGQVKSWLKEGLVDRAVTRDLTWGVEVPLEGAEGKVLYVWFDAPIGYISATKEWAELQGDAEKWKTYWQDDETQLIHFIGKDNIVFHCIMFPAMLQAHGNYILPDNVPSNEFLNLEGRKLSTSRGWAVWLHKYLEEFDGDLMRYALSTTLPENKDSDFSWKDFQTRINTELADVLGNFINRTFTFMHRFFDGDLPALSNPTEADLNALKAITEAKEKISERYERYQFKEAVNETMNLARAGNKYFTDKEPWKTRKTNIEDCGNTLHVCAQLVAALSTLFDPIIPNKMKTLREQLNLSTPISWNAVTEEMLLAGHTFKEADILFNKIEDEVIEAQIEKLRASDASTEETEKNYEPLKEQVEFEDFTKLDLRTGTVIEAEELKKSKKLLKLTVDLGFEQRTILSGIKEYYSADEVKGRNVVIVANLKPRKMMGIFSEGMILMAEDDEGKLFFLSSDAEPGLLIS
jgi:methionyl-tRNA synthetase